MKLKKNIAISETGFLFDPSTGDSYTLNESGRKVMELLRLGKSLEEISEEMTSHFEVDKFTFEKSFFDFLSVLRNNHLLETEQERA